MTTFYLIRHASTDAVGKVLVGRRPGVHLNTEGQAEATQLAARLADAPITHLYSSPLERALETAQPLAAQLGLAIHTSEALSEVEFGDWTNQEIAAMSGVTAWQQWNKFRSATRIPRGELMIEIQNRMVQELVRLHQEHRDSTVAIVSHGDPLRALIAYFLGMPLDFLLRLEINPASITILALDDHTCQLRLFNG